MRASSNRGSLDWFEGPKWLSIPVLYVIIAAISCVLFVFITPPFQGPDEDVHFMRAYQIAEGKILLIKKSDGKVGNALPSQVYRTIIDTSSKPNIRGHSAEKYNYHSNGAALHIKDDGSVRFMDTKNTASYNPIVYTPAAVGIDIARVFHAPPILAMYAARAMTALASISLFFFALKVLAQKKELACALFLLPTLLFQQSVVSIDGISYGVLALFMAYVGHLYGERDIGRKKWIIVGILSVILCCVKPLLFVFLPVILVLYKSDRRTILALSSFVGGGR